MHLLMLVLMSELIQSMLGVAQSGLIEPRVLQLTSVRINSIAFIVSQASDEKSKQAQLGRNTQRA